MVNILSGNNNDAWMGATAIWLQKYYVAFDNLQRIFLKNVLVPKPRSKVCKG